MEVIVNVSQKLLPKKFRNYALSLIKAAIQRGNPSLFSYYYEENPNMKKPFSYHFHFKGDNMKAFYILNGNARLYFSTNNVEILTAFLIGMKQLEKEGYEFYLTEHLTDKAKVKILSARKKKITNKIQILSFLLPDSEKVFSEKTKGLDLKEKIKFYFAEKGLKVKDLNFYYCTKNPIHHRFLDMDLLLNPINVNIEFENPNNELLEDIVYNGVGWFKSQGFGYVRPIFKEARRDVVKN